MSWWALDIQVHAPGRTQMVAWLVERTGQAVEERDDGTLITFAETEAGVQDLTAEILALNSDARISHRPLETTDWSTRWREGLGPRKFGRLVVVPSWVSYRSADDEIVMVLDPETAFGSGEHGSTRAALTLLDQHLVPRSLVLDLGSGSGILAIAACKLGARRAVGIEIDEESNPIAERNSRRNGVAHLTEFLAGNAGDLAPLIGPADLICSNILRTVNLTLFDSIRRSLAPSGTVIFSGMEESEALLFRPELETGGFRAIAEEVDAGWWAALAQATC